MSELLNDILTEQSFCTEEVEIEKEKTFRTRSNKDLEEALKESEDKYLRMLAEYDNFKKRTQKEKEAIYTEAICDSIASFLVVFDNLERAACVDVSNADAQSVVDGVNKILDQVKEVFTRMGVEEIPAIGEQFDPELHNAVMHEESIRYAKNVVSEVLLKGYKLGDKIIRHSIVKVMN